MFLKISMAIECFNLLKNKIIIVLHLNQKTYIINIDSVFL